MGRPSRRCAYRTMARTVRRASRTEQGSPAQSLPTCCASTGLERATASATAPMAQTCRSQATQDVTRSARGFGQIWPRGQLDLRMGDGPDKRRVHRPVGGGIPGTAHVITSARQGYRPAPALATTPAGLVEPVDQATLVVQAVQVLPQPSSVRLTRPATSATSSRLTSRSNSSSLRSRSAPEFRLPWVPPSRSSAGRRGPRRSSAAAAALGRPPLPPNQAETEVSIAQRAGRYRMRMTTVSSQAEVVAGCTSRRGAGRRLRADARPAEGAALG